jgi:hypothetical protein
VFFIKKPQGLHLEILAAPNNLPLAWHSFL